MKATRIVPAPPLLSLSRLRRGAKSLSGTAVHLVLFHLCVKDGLARDGVRWDGTRRGPHFFSFLSFRFMFFFF